MRRVKEKINQANGEHGAGERELEGKEGEKRSNEGVVRKQESLVRVSTEECKKEISSWSEPL